jgi:hypothetical protein
MTNCNTMNLGVYSAQIAATIHPTGAIRPTDNPHHSMKNRIYGILQILIPSLIFGAIIHDGITLKTAHHSGTQTYNVSHK